jgi:hypothetical protein
MLGECFDREAENEKLGQANLDHDLVNNVVQNPTKQPK